MERAEFIRVISPFVPLGTAEYIMDWVEKNPINLNIKNNRKTKLGDFRSPRHNGEAPRISVNGGISRFEFLITLIHEFAHYEVFKKYGRNAQAHGVEWKTAYQELMFPYIERNTFPEPLHSVFIKHMMNPKASSHGDLNLVKALAMYDLIGKKGSYLEDLPMGARFELNGKIFEKGQKRRTRFMCTEIASKKKYTVSALAEVNKV
jgi:hypothetical protein